MNVNGSDAVIQPPAESVPSGRTPALLYVSKSVLKLIKMKNHVVTMNGNVNPGRPKWPVNLLITIWIGTTKIQPASNTNQAVNASPANTPAAIATRFGQKPKRPDVIASLSAPIRYAVKLERLTPIKVKIPNFQLSQLPKSHCVISRPAIKKEMKNIMPEIVFSMKTTCAIPLKNAFIGFGIDLISMFIFLLLFSFNLN